MKTTMMCMKLFLAGVGSCFAYSAAAAQAGSDSSPASSYPSKSIRMVVPFETGSTTDTLARIEPLSKS